MMVARARIALLLLPAAVVLSCADPTNVSPGAVRLEQQRWLAHGLHNYTYIHDQGGFFICCPTRVLVTVRNDSVVSAISTATGQPAAFSGATTIDDMFAGALAAARGGVLAGITFDPQLDYPLRIDIAGPPDASGFYSATNLAPLP